jgi:hypothetical protein
MTLAKVDIECMAPVSHWLKRLVRSCMIIAAMAALSQRERLQMATTRQRVLPIQIEQT